jgi:predicted dehydrogenase
VIVEKPPFLRAADVADVRAAAARAGRLVLVAENYFYKPLAVRLRELLGAGAVGDVLFVHVNAVKRQAGDGWRADTRLAGGGALFEGGIHWVNLLANLGLTPQKVRAFRPGAPEDPACERSMMLAIEYAEGAVGTLLYSWEVPSPLRGLRVSRIFGRRGAIAFESNGLAILVSGAETRLILPGLGDIGGYKAMFRDFIGAMRDGREPRMTLDLAEQDLALVEAAYRSIGSES